MEKNEVAEIVAEYFGSRIIKKKKKFLSKTNYFYDSDGREYKIRYNKKKECFFVDAGEKHFVYDGSVKMSVDNDIIKKYIKYFLEKRNYCVEEIGSDFAKVDGNPVVFDSTKTKQGIKIRLADGNIESPYICSQKHEFLIHLLPYVEFDKTQKSFRPNLEKLLESYEEVEAKGKKTFASWIRKKIYGTDLSNLRFVIEEDGILPELKDLIKSNIKINLGTALASTSAATRILSKLGSFAWFSIAAGIFAGVAGIIAELLYTKKTGKISAHLPESRQAKLAEQYKFSELRGVRSWDNFEKAFFKYEPGLIENYKEKKALLYDIVKNYQFNKTELLNNFKYALAINNKHNKHNRHNRLDRIIENLKPLEEEKIIEILHSRLDASKRAGLLNPSAIPDIEAYIEKFLEELKKKPLGEAKKKLAEEFKYATRFPNTVESYEFVKEANKYRIKHNLIGHILFGLNIAAGYATYLPIKPEAYLPYFLAMGGATTYNAVAFGRIANVFALQGLVGELEKDSTINAISAWNEYASVESKNAYFFGSIGVALGFIAKMISPMTFGISQFIAEGAGIYLRASGYKDWLKFSKDFEARYKIDTKQK